MGLGPISTNVSHTIPSMSSSESSPAAEPLECPIAFFVFNRPAYTRRVMEVIRQVRPSSLLVVADGPRPDRADDRTQCEEVRAIIEETIDWPCRVRREFAEKNLGCRDRISTGLQWVFGQVDRAIILEDDCLPDPSFFGFCQEMLIRFAERPEIGMISGTDYREEPKPDGPSYFFCRHYSIWGWATWRRAFDGYDPMMTDWRKGIGPRELRSHWADWRSRMLHRTMFDLYREGGLDTWDIPWSFHLAKHRRLSLVPRENLVSNIGVAGTRGRGEDRNNHLPTHPMRFPLEHPPGIAADTGYDRIVSRRHRLFRDWIRGRWANRLARATKTPIKPR